MGYNWDFLDKKSYNNRIGHYKFRLEFEFIIDNAKNSLDKVLDIAGGSGRFAIPLFEYSKDITVIDINQTAIELLKERNRQINTICGDFIKTDLQEKFSAILCIEALGYFSNLEFFFKKIYSLLTPEGRIILTYNNPSSWRFMLRKLKHWKKGPYPYYEIKLQELIKVLNKCNLSVENMSGMNWMPLPLSSNSKLVYFFEIFEKVFRLRKWYSQSPWLLMSVIKTPQNGHKT